jgi:hypothetical protein
MISAPFGFPDIFAGGDPLRMGFPAGFASIARNLGIARKTAYVALARG